MSSTRQKNMTLWFLSFIVVVFMAIPLVAGNGHAEGNGGDSALQEKVREFFKIVDGVAMDLETWAKDICPEFSADVLRSLKEQTKIYPINHSLYVLDQEGIEDERDAKNFIDGSEPKIEFSVARWDLKNFLEKKALIYHEFLGIAHIEENHFGSSALYKQKLLERDDMTEKEFRSPLRKHMRDLGSAILDLLNVNFEDVARQIQVLRQGDIYKTATDAYPKSWWQFSSVSKEEQLLATQDISEKISVFPVMGDVRGKNEIIRKRADAFKQWLEPLTDEHRAQVAFGIYTKMMTAKKEAADELSLIHARNLKSMLESCYQLPLGSSVECALEFLMNYVSVTLPSEVEQRKEKVKKLLIDMESKEVDSYYE